MRMVSLAAATSLGFGLGFVPWQQGSESEVYRDSDGRVRCRVGALESGAGAFGVEVLSESGDVVVVLSADSAGARVCAGSPGDEGSVEFTCTDRGSAVRLRSNSGDAIALTYDPGGGVSLTGASKDGSAFELSSNATDGARLTVESREARSTLRSSDGNGVFEMALRGERSVRVACSSDGSAEVALGAKGGAGVRLENRVDGIDSVIIGDQAHGPAIVMQSRGDEGAGITFFNDKLVPVHQIGLKASGEVFDTWPAVKSRREAGR